MFFVDCLYHVELLDHFDWREVDWDVPELQELNELLVEAGDQVVVDPPGAADGHGWKLGLENSSRREFSNFVI